MKLISILLLALTLSACSPSATDVPVTIAGTYVSESGKSTFTFSGSGEVKSKTLLGRDVETTYTVSNGRVSFKFPDGLPVELVINPDGTLSGTVGRLIKQ